MNKYLFLSLTLVAFIIGTGLGYAISPAYSESQSNTHFETFGKADRFVDLRYLDAMIAHHKSAMELANQAKTHSKREEILGLAEIILKEEPIAINELYQWKKSFYGNTREIGASEVPNLGIYDENFDLRFLNALIAHHEEGITMAKDMQTKSTRNEILNNSDAVITFLTDGLTKLSAWREEWYGIK